MSDAKIWKWLKSSIIWTSNWRKKETNWTNAKTKSKNWKSSWKTWNWRFRSISKKTTNNQLKSTTMAAISMRKATFSNQCSKNNIVRRQTVISSTKATFHNRFTNQKDQRKIKESHNTTIAHKSRNALTRIRMNKMANKLHKKLRETKKAMSKSKHQMPQNRVQSKTTKQRKTKSQPYRKRSRKLKRKINQRFNKKERQIRKMRRRRKGKSQTEKMWRITPKMAKLRTKIINDGNDGYVTVVDNVCIINSITLITQIYKSSVKKLYSINEVTEFLCMSCFEGWIG